MTEFATLRPKAFIDLAEDIDEKKKKKGAKKFCPKMKT